MINSKQLFQDFISKINDQSDQDEVASVGFRVFDKVFGLTRTEILGEKTVDVPVDISQQLNEIISRINTREPLQYILNEAYFYNRKFFVDSSVLIPRPETEELVNLVLQYCRKLNLLKPKVLDVGTGSGCIPITFSLEVPGSQVYGLDKSSDALTVAKRNVKDLEASVEFIEHDFLYEDLDLSALDIIISNPPYIAYEEKEKMHSNVTDYEPHMALFVENNDPLIFYKAIAKASQKLLKPGGFVAVEINERFGMETQHLFATAGFVDTEIVKDISGKDRFVFARKS
jgi:release factor glutamine methyltransferase